MLWFSLLVLIPLTAVVAAAAEGGWDRYFSVLSNDQTWAAVMLTVSESLIVTLINIVMGTIIAWVLVRDSFPGKAVLNVDHRRAVRPADDRRGPGPAVSLRAEQPARRPLGVHRTRRDRSRWRS